MSLQTKNRQTRGENNYTFDDFLDKREALDWYKDEPFLQQATEKFLKENKQQEIEAIEEFSKKVSFYFNKLANLNARKEVRPYMEHFDAFNHRIDRIVRPNEVHQLEKEVFNEGLFSNKMSTRESFVKRMLLHQIGEAGVTCPLTCTHGLIGLLEQFPNAEVPELEEVLAQAKEGTEEGFAIGAQFMSEVQGGSDLPANVLEAVPEGDYYRLYGNKFFCSAAQADYAVVTAKISGTNQITTFIVPSWLPGNKEKEVRNGYRINRLKEKLGTCELPTAEIDYDGALAYPVGSKENGIAVAVGIVLTLSRLEIGIACAGFMLRATREAALYSDFRTVFGKKINEYPLAANQIRKMNDAAERATAGAFKIYDIFLTLENPLNPGLLSDKPLTERQQLFNLRELIILQKISLTKEAGDVLHDAISMYGGHGVMEDFTSLPRIFRDVIVNEQWEGPRNLLLTQLFKDIKRVAEWYAPEEFVRQVLVGADKERIEFFSERLVYLLEQPVLEGVSEESMDAAEKWDQFCTAFFKAFQTVAVQEIKENQ